MRKNEKQKIQIQSLAMSGLMAALVCITTCFFKLPVPVTQGYIHLGDAFILVSVALLGRMGIAAAAVGSMLADLLGGYFPYLLPTFVIKGVMAWIALGGLHGNKPFWVQLTAMLLAEAAMVAGYFLVEWLVLGYGLAAAGAAVLPNVVQALSGVVIGAALIPVFRRIGKRKG